MKRENRKVVKSYIKQLKSALVCSSSMKKAFISEVKRMVEELEMDHQVLTMEDLHREIGTPDEIARSFESREDIDKLKAKAKKYLRNKIVCWICVVLAIVAVTVSVVVIISNCDHHYTVCYSEIFFLYNGWFKTC